MVKESASSAAQRAAQGAGFGRGSSRRRLAAAFAAQLPASEWVVLRDLAPPGRASATIDHVVVGPSGVFVVSSAPGSGRATAAGARFRRHGRVRAEAIRDIREAAEAVGAMLPLVRADHVVPALCFTGGDAPDKTIDDVLVCSIYTVAYHLISRPSVLAPDEVQAAAQELQRRANTSEQSSSTARATEVVRKRGLLGRPSS